MATSNHTTLGIVTIPTPKQYAAGLILVIDNAGVSHWVREQDLDVPDESEMMSPE